MQRVVCVLFFLLLAFGVLSQKSDSIEWVTISNNETRTENKARLRSQFLTDIIIMGLKGDPRLFELAKYPDSIYSKTDTACIVLKSGGRWNPYYPPSTKGVIRKAIFSKKKDSVLMNTLDYLKFASQNSAKGYPYYMIDSLTFIKSYSSKDGEILMEIEFVNKPISPNDRRKLNKSSLFERVLTMNADP